MRKLLVILTLFLVTLSVVFAETDSASESNLPKKKITRQHPTVLNIDAGGMLYMPLNDKSAKGGGLMAAGTISPIAIKSMSAGFRAEVFLFAGKGIIHSDNKKKELKAGISGTLVGIYPLARSFEIYGGFGAGIMFKDFDSLTEFDQAWGPVLQGGGRGRLNNYLGVGAELNLMFDITNKTKQLNACAYFSLEF